MQMRYIYEISQDIWIQDYLNMVTVKSAIGTKDIIFENDDFTIFGLEEKDYPTSIITILKNNQDLLKRNNLY